MHHGSAPQSSSPALADDTDRLKSVTIVDDEPEGRRNGLERHHSGSPVGSPLTPSTVGSGGGENLPQPPSPRGFGEGQRVLAASLPDSSSQQQQQQQQQGRTLLVAPVAAVSLSQPESMARGRDGAPALCPLRVIHLDPAQATSQRRPPSHTLRLQPPLHTSESVRSGSDAATAAAEGKAGHGVTPAPVPPQEADEAPPAKRLRLSLTATVSSSAATATTVNSHGGANGGARLAAPRQGRVLRLVGPPQPETAPQHSIGGVQEKKEEEEEEKENRATTPTPEVAPPAEGCKVESAVMENEEGEHTPAGPLVHDLGNGHKAAASTTRSHDATTAEAEKSAEEKASAHAPETAVTASPTAVVDAPADPLAQTQQSTARGLEEAAVHRPPPIITTTTATATAPHNARGLMEGPADTTRTAVPAQESRSHTLPQPSTALLAAVTSAAGATQGGGRFEGGGALDSASPSSTTTAATAPRLRSLTPQPYGFNSGGAHGSSPPRRRHRFVNVNLPSVAPPPQSELFTTFQRTVRDVYEVHEKLSEGTYGEVFRGVDRRTGAVVALKRLKMLSTHQGFPQTSLREVIALRHIQNQRVRLEARHGAGGQASPSGGTAVADPLAEVAQLCDVLIFDRQQPDIVLVFAYATASLAGLLRRQFSFTPAELAYVVRKLLTAVRKLHSMSIIHRDIKSDNVLITSDGEVQLTDFGLCSIVGGGGGGGSRGGGANAWRTPSVITLAYRPPEMLLGSTAYDEKVDVWSVGCLLAQLFLFEPPFYRQRTMQQRQNQNQNQQQQPQRTAATELEQLSRITEILGPLPPSRVFHPESCQHMRVLQQIEEQGRLAESGRADQPPNWGRLQSLFEPSFLFQQFHGFRGWFEAEVQRSRPQQQHLQRRPSQACMDVLCAALQLDPNQRPSAAELLRMPYFTTLDDAPLLGLYGRHLAVTPEREEEVRRGFMLKVQRCGDSHTQRRPH